MNQTAIRVEQLSKKYRIGRRAERHDTLRDALMMSFKSHRDNLSPQAKNDTIWALKDVTFDVPYGQAIGVIGRNGAGKSTLLKILSQITEPTSGRAVINGRVGSLLEVGTGFHPELTGRENIFLNGAILGMTRQEIEKKFDEIVDFAEIEKFIDTPVKRYSSGMYVRLAFAVAAHLEPEILLVDEVLAVGDAVFQQKCLGKMDEVANEGRTILFVSHNTSAIQRLCKDSILIDQGVLRRYGPSLEVVALYLSNQSEIVRPGQWILIPTIDNAPEKQARFVAFSYTSGSIDYGGHAYVDGPFIIDVKIHAKSIMEVDSLAVTLYNEHGTKLVNCDTVRLGIKTALNPGENEFSIVIAGLHLNPGIYSLGLWMANNQRAALDELYDVARIEVLEPPNIFQQTRPRHDGLVSCDFTLFPRHR